MSVLEKQETKSDGNIRICPSCSLLRACPRCSALYCPHFSSKIDFEFCTYCFHDIVFEDSIIRKTITSKSLSGKKTFTRVMTARHLVFKGQDWMFAQARVLDLSDDELATTIEYHRSIMGEMLNEREARKIAANKKNLAVMIKHSTLKIPNLKTKTNTDGTDLIGMDSTTVTTTTVKRTRISATQTNSTQVALTAIIAMMKAQGLSDEQVKAKLIAMAGGSK